MGNAGIVQENRGVESSAVEMEVVGRKKWNGCDKQSKME